MTPKPHLALVPSDLPDPPYPRDTATKGWRFELDLERIVRSDTWILSPPDIRPWLLMVWSTAFRQIPAGSLPSDHKLIAAHIGMEPRTFAVNAELLLRGFVPHADGRLYHPVVVERVIALLEYRDRERERKAKYRNSLRRNESRPTGQTRDSGGVPLGETALEQEQEEDSSLRSESSIAVTSVTARHTSPREARRPPCPYAEIRSLWIEVLPELRAPLDTEHWTPARKAAISARWRDQLPSLESWRDCFTRVRKSRFLMGRVNGNGSGKPFTADLFWIAKPENLLKLYEGKYDG
jgi:hypothetical protein